MKRWHHAPPHAARLVASSVLEVLKWRLQQKKPRPVAEVAEILDMFVVAPVVKGGKP